MESENGVSIENEKQAGVQKPKVEGLTLDVSKEKENVSKSEHFSGGNQNSEDVIEVKEVINPSGAKVESSETASKNKSSNSSRVSNGGSQKNNKLAKDQSNTQGSNALTRKPKPGLTQSLSFPARGRHSDVTRRSIDLQQPVKSDSKQAHKNGSKTDTQVSSGPVTSASRLNPSGKGASSGVNSKSVTANGGKTATRRATTASMSSLRQSKSVKNVSANGVLAVTGTSEVLADQNQKSNPTLPQKEDDACSTTSSNATPRVQHKVTVSAFSFKSAERAEKRKEFLSKIEEKLHAKELEKSNLQEKSKENQELEIKQLRKSLTFKATPMPSFYKEAPPKVELKKIPTTRPISPKLGRDKGNTSTVNNSENKGSCRSPRISVDTCNSPKDPKANPYNGILKNAVKTSKPKTLPRQSSTTKTAVKPGPRKTEPIHKKGPEASEENQNRPVCHPEIEEETEKYVEKNSGEENGLSLPISCPENMQAGVIVQG